MAQKVPADQLDDVLNRADKKAHEKNCVCSCCTSLLYCTGCKCCCCDTDNLAEHGLDHIIHERQCTDVPTLFLFLIVLIIDLALFITAVDLDADPRGLLYWSDWEGNLCAPGESGTCLFVILFYFSFLLFVIASLFRF